MACVAQCLPGPVAQQGELPGLQRFPLPHLHLGAEMRQSCLSSFLAKWSQRQPEEVGEGRQASEKASGSYCFPTVHHTTPGQEAGKQFTGQLQRELCLSTCTSTCSFIHRPSPLLTRATFGSIWPGRRVGNLNAFPV